MQESEQESFLSYASHLSWVQYLMFLTSWASLGSPSGVTAIWLKEIAGILPPGCPLSLFSLSVLLDSLWPHRVQRQGFPVLHYLPEFAQTHVCWVCDAIQLSHPLSPTSPLTLNLSQHQGLFQWVRSFPVIQLFASGGQSVGASTSALVLPRNIQSLFPLGLTGLISLLSKDSQESFPAPQFKSINSSALSFLHSPTHIYTWLLEKP